MYDFHLICTEIRCLYEKYMKSILINYKNTEKKLLFYEVLYKLYLLKYLAKVFTIIQLNFIISDYCFSVFHL